MLLVRKAGLVLVTALLTTGALGAAAPAQADTSWGCGGHCRPAR